MGGSAHRVVILATGLALMVVLHIVVAVWALFRARPSRRVAEHAEEDGGAAAAAGAGLSAEEVAELPRREFKEGADGAGVECAVCLEAFRAGDHGAVLPRCGHVFHADCVGSWLRKSSRCPVCRAHVVEQRKDAADTVAEDAAATVEVVTEESLQRV